MSYSSSTRIPPNVDREHFIANEKEVKKALKKLKEIELLKQKSQLNREEQEKVDKEKYWNNIVYPSKYEPDPKIEKERKRKQNERHAEKMKKKEERKRTEPQEEPQPKFYHEKEKVITELEREFFEMFSKTDRNADKTFRKLSTKYHPDKNTGRKEWAEHNQKLLGELREKYRTIERI